MMMLSGTVSWVSPIARALIKAREGDTIELRAPPASSSSKCSKSATPPPMARHAEAPDPRALWQASPRAPRVGPLLARSSGSPFEAVGAFRSRASVRSNPSSRHATANEQWPPAPAPPRWRSLLAFVTTGAAPLLPLIYRLHLSHTDPFDFNSRCGSEYAYSASSESGGNETFRICPAGDAHTSKGRS